MKTSEFLKIKLTASSPQFKELIGLKENNNTSFLIDFCTMMHKNASKTSQGNKCEVLTPKTHYVYSLFENCILKTNVNSGVKTKYTL